MEDCDLVLQAITKGFTFLRCNEVLRHCPMNKAAGDKGGCSEVYQDDDAMRQTTSYLINKWGADDRDPAQFLRENRALYVSKGEGGAII